MMTPGAWKYDEIAFAGDEHLDAEYVRGYDAKAQFDPVPDVAALRGLGLDGASVVVDLGAGTGAFAMAVAPYCHRVVAVDVSRPMLRFIEHGAETANLTNVETVHAGFLSYEHSGEPADVVYSRNALHHLPDMWKVIALGRVAGFMRPGGVLLLRDLVYSFEPHEAEAVFERWFATAVSDPAIGYTAEELRTHVRSEHSTFSWLLAPMLERSGFEILSTEHGQSRTLSAYLCRNTR